MPTSQFCPVCGAANELSALRCFACGQALSAQPASSEALLLERYQILSTLGTGGFSVVSKVLDRQSNRVVALKQINLSGLKPEEAIDATNTFNREVNILSSLSHPQVPRFYDHFQDRDHWYLALEYLEGPTLETYLETRQAQGKPVLFEETLNLILQLCPVLDYLHTRQPPLIFRDLKPGNIIRGPGGKLSLIDFGIARYFRQGQSRDTQLLGSPGYASPEHYGKAQTTPQSDIYSLGVLLYALLSGSDPSEHQPDLARIDLSRHAGGKELQKLLRHMLASEPAYRPQSIRAVMHALEWIKQHEQLSQRSTRIWTPPIPLQPPVLPLAPTTVLTSGKQQHMQFQTNAQAGQTAGAAPKQRHTRRNVLIGLGSLSALVVTGGGLYKWLVPASVIGPGGASGSAPLYLYNQHTASVQTLAWSPDGNKIASGSLDTLVAIWNFAKNTTEFTYQALAGVKALAYAPDGLSIASGDSAGLIDVWRVADGLKILTTSEAQSQVTSIAYAPDGSKIASAYTDGSVQVWDAKTSVVQATIETPGVLVNAVAWSPDGQKIAYACDDGKVAICDSNCNFIAGYSTNRQQNAVVWSSDGQFIASGGVDNMVHIWSSDATQLLVDYSGHTDIVNALAWSVDGLLASASDDQTVRIWSAADPANGNNNISALYTYTGHRASVRAVAWSPDATLVASGSDDNSVQVWNVSS